MKLVLTAARAYTPLDEVRHPILVVEDGVISVFGPRDAITVPTGAQVIDFGDSILAPGFVDIHVHGGAGQDVMQASDSALAAIGSHLAKQGVTSYCPTTVTAPVDKTLASLERLGVAVKGGGAAGRAQPLGLHLEGPFISAAKCGVHPVADIQAPSVELFERLREASGNTVRIMTVAPELPGAAQLIATAKRNGVRLSLGHSDATTAPTQAAIDAGATHATHTFNAMRSLDHRDPGILGITLTDDRLSADIIADGIHVAPDMIKLFLTLKGEERAVLITDAISASGMPEGRYKLGAFEVDVRDGRCTYNGRLAGSVLKMDRAVRNIMDFAGWPLQRALRLATLNPARVIGRDDRKGALAVGKDADIVALSPHGEVLATLCRGVRLQG